MNSPNIGIPYVPEGTLDPAAGLNDAIDVLDALVQTGVIAMDLTAPPGSPQDGDMYVPAAPATGAWTGLAGYVVRYRSEGAFWQSFTPGVQAKFLLNLDDLNFYRFDSVSSPGAWSLAAGLGDAPVDGTRYARKDATWVTLPDPLTVQDENSPVTIETEVDEITFAGRAEVTVPGPGQVRVDVLGGLVIQTADSPPDVVDALTLVIGDNLTLTDLGGGAALLEGEAGGGGGGSENVTQDTHPSSADDMDDEFEEGSLDAKWSWVNQNGASVNFNQGALQLVGSTASAATNNNMLVQVAPTAPWKVRAKVHLTDAAANAGAALVAYNTANQNLVIFGVFMASGPVFSVYAQRCDDPTTFNTNLSTGATAMPIVGADSASLPVYLEMENDGTNLYYRFSVSGFEDTFILLQTEPIASHIAAVDRVGILANSVSVSRPARSSWDWFRRVA
jgi:hypothetical protein